tara:strand:- start:21 stop:1184 length:1164 start_codon:yes stop_codon:yes gene_type:complete
MGFNSAFNSSGGSQILTDLEVDSPTVVVDETNDRVGIGTASPGTKLQVEDNAPYVTLKNSTSENTDGGCESKLIFEDHADVALGQIEVSHSGSSDDTKGKMILSTHTGSSLVAAITVNEAQNVVFAGDLRVSGNNIVDNGGSAGISFDGSGNTQVDGDLTVNGGDLQYSNGQNATMSIAAVSGTNTAGRSLTISGGQSTGNAAGGSIVFKSSAPGASGSSANSLATVFTIEEDGDIVVPGDIEMADGKAIVDSNNAKLLKFCEVGSAVNYVEIENAADGSAPSISALGDSANITISMKPKGTGGLRVYGSTASAASLLLNEDSDNGTNFVQILAAANIGSNFKIILPATVGATGKVLQSTVSSNEATLDWTDLGSDLNHVLHMQVFT